MPIVSVINIDGDPEKRKDHTPRKDHWLRDNRIDLDVQLNDKIYRNSRFDKGHMSRREDANWGDTGGEAHRNAVLTCMHTNACPQVPALNQSSRKGLWGQLENLVLEGGVKEEEGKSAKICVYNGPIFDPNDRVLKGSDGIQVPVSFFKVIVWLNGKGQKKTTAFILSQEDLVDDGQFEVLAFDELEEFKEHECSISALEKLTGLVFTGIREWDTYKSKNKKDVSRIGKDELESLISENS
jgi:endonuclease G